MFDLIDFLERRAAWSVKAFGPASHRGPVGPLEHLRKEIDEALADPSDIMEFADLIFLATDAAHRAGHSPQAICEALERKLDINRRRDWGDWREKPADTAIEHMRDDIETQRAEFDAVARLIEAHRDLPPVVDDDYPRCRHLYEAALRDLLNKCAKNGRRVQP